MIKHLKIIGFVIFTIFCVTACASSPDIVRKERRQGEAHSPDEVRQITVDQPFLISGDYFRDRESQNTTNISDLFSKAESKPPESSVLEQASTPKTEQTLASSEPVETQPIGTQTDKTHEVINAPKQFPVKIGFLIDGAKVARNTAERITQDIPTLTRNHPVVIVDGELIHESLSHTDCLKNRDLFCVSKTVGLYPGARMLMIVEEFSLPETFPGTAVAKITTVDTGLNYRYPAMEISAQLKQQSEADGFMRGVLLRIVEFAVQKSTLIPSYCRCFSTEKDRWYITAGEKSGLKLGDSLQVLKPGHLVKSPAGTPAGWIPGKPKGVIRVDHIFGDDFAMCSLISGEGPKPEDLIIQAE